MTVRVREWSYDCQSRGVELCVQVSSPATLKSIVPTIQERKAMKKSKKEKQERRARKKSNQEEQ